MVKHLFSYVIAIYLGLLSFQVLALDCPNLSFSTPIFTPVTIDKAELTQGCVDERGTVSISIVDNISANGSFISDNGATIIYSPDTGSQSSDKFSFTLIDDLSTVNVSVNVFVDAGIRGNFTLMDTDGKTYAGANDVIIDWDQLTFNTNESDNNFSIISITSETTLFDEAWQAHHIRVYDGGETGRLLSFDTTCTVTDLESGTSDCGGSSEDILTLDIPPFMYGVHIHFDWFKSTNIDIINVWELNGLWEDSDGIGGTNDIYQGQNGVPPGRNTYWALASKDVNGDGINGAPMIEIDGPFTNNYANFSWNPAIVESCELFELVTDPKTGDCIDESEINSASASLGYLYLLFNLLIVYSRRQLNI